MSGGRKPKPRYELVPAEALEEVVLVITRGAEKHPERGWENRTIEGEIGATLRHIFAYLSGTPTDPEWGANHLAHAGSRLLFALALAQRRPDLAKVCNAPLSMGRYRCGLEIRHNGPCIPREEP